MRNPNGNHRHSTELVAEPVSTDMEEFRQAAIEWAKASEATRVFLILEPLSALTNMPTNPAEYYSRMRAAFEKEAAARDRYFRAVKAFLEARKDDGDHRSS